MLPSGPLVMVIVSGGADSTKRNTAPASTRTAKSSAAMVMARLTPNTSIIIVSKPGLGVGKPPAAVWPVKSFESLSLLIGWQRRLQNQLEKGESPDHMPEGTRRQKRGETACAVHACLSSAVTGSLNYWPESESVLDLVGS